MGNLISQSHASVDLSWSYRRPPPDLHLPKGVTRTFIKTASGHLELLVAKAAPGSSANAKPALLFQHGGFGCAMMYLDFMSYFSARGFDCYALSIRAHGHSWRPNWWRMTLGTSADELAGDIAAAVEHLKTVHGRPPVLLGHSNGGGLSQIMLDKGMTSVAGLILLASAPNYGGTKVNQNWAAADRWFFPRLLWHGLHPRSPLSSPELVHRLFFSPQFPMDRVRAFFPLLSDTEAWRWPVATVFRDYVDPTQVLQNCQRRMLVVGGERDILFDPAQTRRMGTEYSAALQALTEREKSELPGKPSRSSLGVPTEIITGAGHHVQNDLQWEDAAATIQKWLESTEKD